MEKGEMVRTLANIVVDELETFGNGNHALGKFGNFRRAPPSEQRFVNL